MKKLFALRKMLLLLLLLAVPVAHPQPETPQSASPDELFRTIASLDSALFDAYNRCDLDKFGAFFTADVEFYHDQTGLTRSRERLVEDIKKNICGKVRRELVPGTLEVYPLRSYGAVEIGVHRFCDPKRGKCDEASGIAKFIHLWENKDGAWRITRVISYDHMSRSK